MKFTTILSVAAICASASAVATPNPEPVAIAEPRRYWNFCRFPGEVCAGKLKRAIEDSHEITEDDALTGDADFDGFMDYYCSIPRLSYLPFLLARLHDFFSASLIDPDVGAHEGWFSFDGVPLKWQHPVGLLYDVFSGAEPVNARDLDTTTARHHDEENGSQTLPWKLVLQFTRWPSDLLIPLDPDGKVHHDAYINSVKEADFLRNGTAKAIMSLSKEDSTKLWQSVQIHDCALFNSINSKFLNPADGAVLRHVPIKVYLPTSSPVAVSGRSDTEPARGTLKVIQSLVPRMLSSREPQTLGTALHGMLPTVFPSRRSYIHAQAVLHGAIVPLVAPVEDLMKAAAYPDGFLHFSVVMVG